MRRRKTAFPNIQVTKGSTELTAKSEFTNAIECVLPIENLRFYRPEDGLTEDYPLSVFPQVLKFGSSDRYEFSFLGQRDTVFCKFFDDGNDCTRLMLFGPVVETDDI